ncbi:hypothetical protein [Actinosynnema sp. NPDC020468]|uniref:hypothetical protein n=1 Tax=Actinosynnema sp. NPDC020468 TaxID=3154488 RepID=UPI0033F0A464
MAASASATAVSAAVVARWCDEATGSGAPGWAVVPLKDAVSRPNAVLLEDAPLPLNAVLLKDAPAEEVALVGEGAVVGDAVVGPAAVPLKDVPAPEGVVVREDVVPREGEAARAPAVGTGLPSAARTTSRTTVANERMDDPRFD